MYSLPTEFQWSGQKFSFYVFVFIIYCIFKSILWKTCGFILKSGCGFDLVVQIAVYDLFMWLWKIKYGNSLQQQKKTFVTEQIAHKMQYMW